MEIRKRRKILRRVGLVIDRSVELPDEQRAELMKAQIAKLAVLEELQ